MPDYVVNIPVWYVYYVQADNAEDALLKAQIATPDDVQAIEDMQSEVNLEAKE